MEIDGAGQCPFSAGGSDPPCWPRQSLPRAPYWHPRRCRRKKLRSYAGLRHCPRRPILLIRTTSSVTTHPLVTTTTIRTTETTFHWGSATDAAFVAAAFFIATFTPASTAAAFTPAS